MIKAVFYIEAGEVKGFTLSGHSGAAESGQDIICAAVSGAVQCVITVLEESFGIKGFISVVDGKDNIVSCDLLKAPESKEAYLVLDGFAKTMEEWERDFPQNINVKKISI